MSATLWLPRLDHAPSWKATRSTIARLMWVVETIDPGSSWCEIDPGSVTVNAAISADTGVPAKNCFDNDPVAPQIVPCSVPMDPEHTPLAELAGAVYRYRLTQQISNRSISLSSGGAQTVSIDLGKPAGNLLYLMLGGVSGVEKPQTGLAGSVQVPLIADVYLNLVLAVGNSGPFANFVGVLDPSGNASATITLPASSDPSLSGLTLYHSAVVFDALLQDLAYGTNATELVLVN